MPGLTEQELSNFVAASIPSVWALEILLLLKRTAPGGRRIEQLISELRSSAVAIGQGLQRLERVGLIVHGDDEYRYAPATTVLARLADEVEKAYAIKPVWLVNVILSAKNEHLQVFANSFRLKE